MTQSIKIVVNMAAVPCPRPRIYQSRASYPKSYLEFKTTCARLIVEELAKIEGFKEISTPVECKIKVLLKKPKSGKLEYPRGDVDNYGKSVLDAMTQSGVWKDDNLVHTLTISKGYDDEPKIVITIKP